jgi:hypothetical protein
MIFVLQLHILSVDKRQGSSAIYMEGKTQKEKQICD